MPYNPPASSTQTGNGSNLYLLKSATSEGGTDVIDGNLLVTGSVTSASLNTGAVVSSSSVTCNDALVYGAVTAGSVTSSGNSSVQGNLSVNGNTTLNATTLATLNAVGTIVSGSSVTANSALIYGGLNAGSVTCSGLLKSTGTLSVDGLSALNAITATTISAQSSMTTPALTNGSLGATTPGNIFGTSGDQVWTTGQATMVVAGWRIIWGTTQSGNDGIGTVNFVVPFATGCMPVVIPSVMPSAASPNYIMVAANGSGFGASPTNTTAQFKVLNTSGGNQPSSISFVAFGKA